MASNSQQNRRLRNNNGAARAFGADVTNGNDYVLGAPPAPLDPIANRGNANPEDSMADQRSRAQARNGGNPARASRVRPQMVSLITPRIIGSGHLVPPPNDTVLYSPIPGPFPYNRIWFASVSTTVDSNSLGTTTGTLGGELRSFQWSDGNSLRDRNLLGAMDYLGVNCNISTPALQLWLLFQFVLMTGEKDLRGTLLHLSCDQSTAAAFEAVPGQDRDFDLCWSRAKDQCTEKGLTFSFSRSKAAVDLRAFATMEKELAQAKTWEKKYNEIKSKFTSTFTALKTELVGLRAEMGRHGNALSMLSLQSQPKRKNQDSDPDQSIRSSKSVRH